MCWWQFNSSIPYRVFMANNDSNTGCIIMIVGFVIGTILFNLVYTDKVWDRVLNAPASAGLTTTSIGLWAITCLACSGLIGLIWKSFK